LKATKTNTRLERKEQEQQQEDDRLKPYHEEVDIFLDEVSTQEETRKQRILRMVLKLEDSGLYDGERKRLICGVIVHDLRLAILDERISERRIYKYIPEKYKLQKGPKGTRTKYEHFNFAKTVVQLIEHLTNRDIDRIKSLPIGQMIERSRTYRERELMALSDDEIIVYHQTLPMLNAVLTDYLDLIDKEKDNRARKAQLYKP
jgi:hypothetical protein